MKLKEQEGITLIALVVTVVVLLIIASISIAVLIGDNSIIRQAGKSKEDTEIAEEIELVEIAAAKATGKDKNGKLKHDNFINQLDKAIKENAGREYKLEPETDSELYKVTYLDTNRFYFVNGEGEVSKEEFETDPDLEYFNYKIEITTELASYNESLGVLPIVYNIVGINKGKIVCNELKAINMAEPGKKTIDIELKVPANTTITVIQEYRGHAYNILSDERQSIELTAAMAGTSEAVASLQFKNEYNNKTVSNGESNAKSIIYKKDENTGNWDYTIYE